MNQHALVTGASRGIGRGTALSLARQGYDLAVTGRTVGDLDSLAREIEALGRTCRTVVCDHEDREATVRAFEDLEDVTFDVAVNNAWGGYERMVEAETFTWERPFWEQPDHRWTSMMDVGVRTAFLSSRHAARGMVRAGRGLIVNISFWAARMYMQNVIYGVSKASIDKMTSDMAHELTPWGVSMISLYPGLVRTESVLKNAQFFNLENSESTEFVGLVVGGLARDQALSTRSGRFFTTAELARDYDLVDVDGKVLREERLAP